MQSNSKVSFLKRCFNVHSKFCADFLGEPEKQGTNNLTQFYESIQNFKLHLKNSSEFDSS